MNEQLKITKRQLKQILDDAKNAGDNMEIIIFIDKPYDVYWHLATEDDE